ncbi:MAG: bifunctional diaminohydroxyphosphoribosylaminopyrimidine deaminase/5-amino-6-(5-phosphoribosylamino)uracil reductase RibD [Deltaproteobacteria bacterium]|nr:bifunctional diaminohydroxyphosphoribosylaminopyrimidine deaminase/5-amino-6-(5-phosphoribosylamino)uracil reductase RibD [Deltaproteobacteria bacterium]
MRQALRLARRARGDTSPNPMVGAVLVREGAVVGAAYHRRAGEPHAEVHALAEAGARARGATLYVTLEPCAHHGRTPPCAEAILRAGVDRVVVGMVDPNPLVAGRGLAQLRAAGAAVTTGVLEDACQALNEAFCKFITTGRPFVILKGAASLDGKIATRTRDSKWITGEAARRYVHMLRREVDAILVGIGTIEADDPLLTPRGVGRRSRTLYRVVADSRLRIAPGARVLAPAPACVTIVAPTVAAPPEKVALLEARGVRVLRVPGDGGRVDLPALVAELGKLPVVSLLIEGGGEINAEALRAGLVDKLLLFLAPKLIGGRQAVGLLGGEGPARVEEALGVQRLRVRRFGDDILLEGYLGQQGR